jgi:hypothetical protein
VLPGGVGHCSQKYAVPIFAAQLPNGPSDAGREVRDRGVDRRCAGAGGVPAPTGSGRPRSSSRR